MTAVDFYANTFPILYPCLENSTTRNAIFYRYAKISACCFKDNVQTAIILGIILTVHTLVTCCGILWYFIINGILGALIHCILIFGAYFRNRIVIIVWMICAIVTCIINLVVVILGILDFQRALMVLGNDPQGSTYLVFSVYLFGVIIFEIWIILVANNARKEIEASNQIPKSLF